MIFAGLNCHCGETHYQAASYYVSIIDGSRHVLAVGPFTEHSEALAHVDAARRIVMERYNPDGRAHWYGYGTAVVHGGSARPGKLNGEILA